MMTPGPSATGSAIGPRGPGGGALELMALAGSAVAVVIAGVLWLTGQLGALLWHRRWPSMKASEVGLLIGRIPAHPSDPAQAWPQRVRPDLPATMWLYLIAAVVLAAVAVVVVIVRRAASAWSRASGEGWSRPPRAVVGRQLASGAGHWRLGRPGPGAHWATGRELACLQVSHRRGGIGAGRVVLGRVGRRLVAAEQRQSVLVLGPSQSGKTTALAIPALLEWEGPVVATSVKGDLVGHTRAFRQTLGRTWVFDPTGTAGAGPSARWSPLVEADTWSGAQRVATALVEATPAQGGLSDGAFWFAASAKLLAPLLLAARRSGRTMTDVVRWTNLGEIEEVERVLDEAGDADAIFALVAGAGRDERIRSSIYTTLETVLAPYEDPQVARSAEAPDFDPCELLEGSHTLYLCGPAHEQFRVQGVFSSLVGSIVQAAAARNHRLGRPLEPALLVVLDEVANIAPLKQLDTLASTGAGMGLQLVTVCQDLAQLSARYGAERARTIANNHRAKVILSGIADIGTLDTVSGLAGEQAVREETVTSDLGERRRSRSSSVAYRRLAPADELRRISPGQGVLIYGHLPPARLALRPWHADAELSQRVRRADVTS